MICGAILLLAAASGQTDCSDAFNREGRAGLHDCLSSQLELANEDLRVAWVAALERAKLEDQRKRENTLLEFQEDFSSVVALTKAQRGWNSYRDNHCTTQELSMWPGVGGTSLYLGCMGDMARARAAELKQYSETGQFR